MIRNEVFIVHWKADGPSA